MNHNYSDVEKEELDKIFELLRIIHLDNQELNYKMDSLKESFDNLYEIIDVRNPDESKKVLIKALSDVEVVKSRKVEE